MECGGMEEGKEVAGGGKEAPAEGVQGRAGTDGGRLQRAGREALARWMQGGAARMKGQRLPGPGRGRHRASLPCSRCGEFRPGSG